MSKILFSLYYFRYTKYYDTLGRVMNYKRSSFSNRVLNIVLLLPWLCGTQVALFDLLYDCWKLQRLANWNNACFFVQIRFYIHPWITPGSNRICCNDRSLSENILSASNCISAIEFISRSKHCENSTIFPCKIQHF